MAKPRLKPHRKAKQRHTFVAPETKPKANTATIDEFAQRITTAWRKQVEAIIETGRLLIEAKDQLQHGQWLEMFDGEKLPFSVRTAQRLMKIARHPILSNPTHVSFLPPSWRTLHDMTDIPDEELERLIKTGTINSETEGSEIDDIRKRLREDGLYVYENFCRAIATAIRFKEQWPEHGPLVDAVMHEQGDESEDPLVDWALLPELTIWLTELHRKCVEADRRERELEEQQEREEREREALAGRPKLRRRREAADVVEG